MMINDNQASLIRGYLMSNGISSYSLQEDLMDHFCCVIEDTMDQGKTFDDSFTIAIDRVAPDGPARIQEDLNYLLTIKKRIMLRKIVFVISYFSVFIMLSAIALRIPQIIEANLTLLMVMIGLMIFSMSAVPYFFYEMYLRSVRKLKES